MEFINNQIRITKIEKAIQSTVLLNPQNGKVEGIYHINLN